MYLSLLSAVAVKKKKRMRHLSKTDFSTSEVVVFRSHRNPFDVVISQLGLELVELAYSNHYLINPYEDINNAISENTIAVYYLMSGWVAPGAPSLDTVISIAHDRGIPVIVDAAAMTPPVENLWNYTNLGADLVIFSGGKDIHGPQASGLILGKKKYIDILLEEGFPVHGYGRMLKVGREEMVGLYSALKQYLNQDFEDVLKDAENQVAYACSVLAECPFYCPARSFPNEAGQPVPRVRVALPSDIDSSTILDYLKTCKPAIILAADGEHAFFINPMSMTMDDMKTVCNSLLSFKKIVNYNMKGGVP